MINQLRNIFANLFCKFFLLTFPNSWSLQISSNFNTMFYDILVNGKKLKLLSNTELLLYRSQNFLEKEPETTKWISEMPSDAIFYDVGANVGIFTIMAAVYCRKVYAFEPVAVNYSVLNQNLLINNLDKVAVAYCLAISDKSLFDTMRLSSGIIGSAHHTFGTNLNANHKEYIPTFKQGSLAISLDDFVYTHHFECPTYLKIDVDGNEHLVIGGAKRLLQDSRLKSILIELNKNLKIDQNLVETIKENGFELTELGEDAVLDGMKIGNLIFFRK